MSVFYTSDPHFGHSNIIKYCDRPFASAAEMNEALIANWNKVVRLEDRVYVLGDITSGAYNGLECVKRLNGEKILVSGNHDKTHPMHKRWEAAFSVYREAGFSEIVQFGVRHIGKYKVMLSHFPYAGDYKDGRENRFLPYALHDAGLPLLHGHTHSKNRDILRSMHVGMDAWNYTPVPESIIVDWLHTLEHL